MMHFAYLGALLATIGAFVLLDWRLKLAFFYDRRRSIITVVTGLALFIVWDILGIRLNIFLPGKSAYNLGIMLAPKFPIEELFFLVTFVYMTLILWRLGERYVHISDS